MWHEKFNRERNQMSCTSNTNNPCSQVASQESIASMLSNLTSNLFGTITKTVTNGVAVWSTVCNALSEVAGYPRLPGEGFVCYIIRILPYLAFNHRGIYNAGTAYKAGDVVTFNQYYWYKALFDTLGNAPTNPVYWTQILVGPTGPAGAGGTPADNTQVVAAASHNLLNTDAVIFYEPTADSTVQLDLVANYDAGKWFEIRTNSSAYTVTILPGAGETINGGASFVLSVADSSVKLRSVAGSTDWRTL